jgi:hypothetical protein
MTDKHEPELPQDLSTQAYEIARRRQAAAAEVVTMLEDQFQTTFASHAGTLLRAAAWLSGTSLYRSFRFAGKIPPGSPILSDQSNEEGLKLLKVFMFLIDKDGIKLKQDDFSAEIPPAFRSTMGILQVQEQFQDTYNEIMKKHGFDFAEGARTGAVACARLMKLHCVNRTDLNPPMAASIVTMGFVEGAKTSPAPLKKR